MSQVPVRIDRLKAQASKHIQTSPQLSAHCPHHGTYKVSSSALPRREGRDCLLAALSVVAGSDMCNGFVLRACTGNCSMLQLKHPASERRQWAGQGPHQQRCFELSIHSLT